MSESQSGFPNANPSEATAQSSDALRAKLASQLDEPSARLLNPPPIPDHTLLRCIGEGACGEVWLARNALGTLRAVKIVYRARFKDDRPFEREVDGILKYEPLSRTHEGLVQVLHVGRNDEAACFYYVMELADDVERADRKPLIFTSGESEADVAGYAPRTLRSELACHQRLPPTEAAQFVSRLAKALGYLHDQGLVHRDIKPSNVIFVSGQPKLADIGLVTRVGSSHSFVGTEGFIPPEGPGTPQGDLYALGKLLYELATGRDRMDFPQLPSNLRQLPDGEAVLELNEVVTRACAPDPGHRYSTATQLQAELDLFLSGRSLRRTRTIERGLARLKRLAITACVLLALTAAALWFSKREEWHALEREQAASERALSEFALRQRAEAAEQESRQRLYTSLLEQARATVRSGDVGQRLRALDAIRQAAAISNSVELRGEVFSALALPDLQFQRELPVGPELTAVRLDQNFERIAICRGLGPVEIHAVADNRLLATLPASTNSMCHAMTWSKDGHFLTVRRDSPSESNRGDLEVWKVDEPRQVLLIRDTYFKARTYHPHRQQILTAGADGWITAWDLASGRELARAKFEATPENLAYSPDGERVAASYKLTNEWVVSIHNATNGAMLLSRVIANSVSAFDWHPGGQWVGITDYGGNVHLLDSYTGELRTLGRHKAEAVSTLFSPDGNYLLTGGWERELICWDVRTMQRTMTIGLDTYEAQFRADGQACALLAFSRGVKLHAFIHPSAHRRFPEDLGPRLRRAAFSSDGKLLAASADKRVGVWDLGAPGPGAFADGGPGAQLFWARDGKELFGSSRGENCYRWRVHPATNASAPPVLQRMELQRPGGFVSLNLSADKILWTTTKGSRIADVEEVTTDDGYWGETIRGISGVSPGNRLLGIFRPYGTVLHVYRLPTIEPVAWLTNQAAIAGFSFSPTGDEIGVGSRGQIEFWSTSNWERTRIGTNFIGFMDVGVLFQPDGRTGWLAKDFRTAGLFDLRTFEPIFFLPTGMSPMALNHDGRQIAIAVDAQRLELWDLVAVRKHFRELGLDWVER